MEEITKEVVKQIPSLAVLAMLTYVFLKHLAVRDLALGGVMVEHAKLTAHSNEIISLNTKSMTENTRALDEMRRSLHSASTKITEAVQSTNGGKA